MKFLKLISAITHKPVLIPLSSIQSIETDIDNKTLIIFNSSDTRPLEVEDSFDMVCIALAKHTLLITV